MPDYTLQTQIEVDGQPLDPELTTRLEQVLFEDYLHAPDMLEVTFRDIERRVLADARIRIGSQVRLAATGLGGGSPEVLVEAEVTGLEAEYSAAGSRVVVRAYDPSHRLHRGRRTETYVRMKDSDIAARVAGRLGIARTRIDDSGEVLAHVSQANESDWSFLQQRAREIGFEIGVDKGVFFFRKPAEATGGPDNVDFTTQDPLALAFGQDLLEFHPRLSSAEQVREVSVRGWDVRAKQPLVGRAPARSSAATLTTDPAQLASRFGDPTYTVVDRPLDSQAAVDLTARAVADRIGSAFAEAVGVARGNPRLKAGTPITVGVVADPFAGRYVITSSRHRFDRDGYRTRFVVSGRLDRSLLALAGGAAGSGAISPPIHGVVVALVTSNDDPDRQGRVKLKFPWLSDQYESDWARLAMLGAGPSSGAVFIPQVRDEVLVAFEFGDIRRPYVVGGLWNGVDTPRLVDTPGHAGSPFDNGAVQRRGLVSRRGHRAVFLDAAGESGIDLVTSDDKLRITLDESGTEIQVSSDGSISIRSQRDISITSQAGITIEAGGTLALKGRAVDVDGNMITLN